MTRRGLVRARRTPLLGWLLRSLPGSVLASVLVAGSLVACSADDTGVTSAATSTAAATGVATPDPAPRATTTPVTPSPRAAPSVSAATLDAVVRTALGSRRSTSTACLVDLRTGATYVYNSSLRIHTASIVKVLVLVSVIRYQADRGRSLTSTQRALASRMIRWSDNNATSELVRQIGHRSVTKVITALGMSSTTFGGSSWGHTLTSAGDQARLVTALVRGTPVLTAAQRGYVLDLMEDVTPSQHWGVGTEPAGAKAQVKNGWYPESGGWRVNSIGHVTGRGGRDYVLTILTRGSPSMGSGIARVNAVAKAVYTTMALPLAR